MKILYSVGKLLSNHSLDEQVKLAKEAGFDGIDYMPYVRDIFSKPDSMLALSKTYHMPIMGIHVPIALVLKTPSFFYERLLQYVMLFPDCNVFNLHLSGFITPLHRDGENLKKFVKLAKDKNITISFESNPDEYKVLKYYPQETWEPEAFAQFCIRNNVPMNMDTSHIDSWGYNTTEYFKKYASQIGLLHLSDSDEHKQHLPFGKGKQNLKAFFAEVKKRKIHHDIVFEIFQFPKDISFAQRKKDLKESLQFFKSSVT